MAPPFSWQSPQLWAAACLFGDGGVGFNIQNLALTIGTSAIVFWACAVFYLVALGAALSIRTVSSGVIDRRRSFWANTAAGFVYTYRTTLVFGIILMTLAHCVLVMSLRVDVAAPWRWRSCPPTGSRLARMTFTR